MNIFDCAMKIEEEAKTFYERLSSESCLPEMKTLFSMLAAAEQQHIDTLARMKLSRAAQSIPVQNLNESECSYRALPAKKNLLAELKNDPDFFIHAVREEERDIRYFQDLAVKAKDEELRMSLMLIVEEERKHLDVVENIYSFAEAPRNYLEWGEFSNLQTL